MPTPKEEYDARQQLKRIARGDEPDAKSHEDLLFDALFSLAERFVIAVECIEMNSRRNGQGCGPIINPLAALSTPATDPKADAETALIAWWNSTHDFDFVKDNGGIYEAHAHRCWMAGFAARPAPQPAADTRVVQKLAEALWYESEGGAVEPLYEVSNHAKFVPEYEDKARAILSAIIGNTALTAPSDKIAEAARDVTVKAAQLKAISLALAKITGRDWTDEAALDRLAAEIRAIRAIIGEPGK